MSFLNKHGKIYNYAVGIYLLFWQIGRFSFKFLRYEEDFYHFRAFAGHFGDFCLFSRKKTHKCGIRQPRNRAFGDSQGQFGGQSITNFTRKRGLEGRTGVQGPEQNGQAKPQGGLVRDSTTADPGTDFRPACKRQERRTQGDHPRRSGQLGDSRLPEKGVPRPERGPLEQVGPGPEVRPVPGRRCKLLGRLPVARHLPLRHRCRRRDHHQADGGGEPEGAGRDERKAEFQMDIPRQLAQGAYPC